MPKKSSKPSTQNLQSDNSMPSQQPEWVWVQRTVFETLLQDAKQVTRLRNTVAKLKKENDSLSESYYSLAREHQRPPPRW